MLSDKVKLETKYDEALKLFHVKTILKTHEHLSLKKGVIYYIVSDEEILKINRETLNHDYYTDIITFDYETDDDIEDNELVISWDRIKDNAKKLGEPLVRELHRVCIHGMLHLAGYSDYTEKEKNIMREQENLFLDLYCST